MRLNPPEKEHDACHIRDNIPGGIKKKIFHIESNVWDVVFVIKLPCFPSDTDRKSEEHDSPCAPGEPRDEKRDTNAHKDMGCLVELVGLLNFFVNFQREKIKNECAKNANDEAHSDLPALEMS